MPTQTTEHRRCAGPDEVRASPHDEVGTIRRGEAEIARPILEPDRRWSGASDYAR